MKILRLRFENINSLYGQWEIDFSTSEYMSNGIFAIVGATGAGKSTVLDALSLALYGRTPRLNVVSAGSNEVMSRGTGGASAEVYFEVKGRQYSAHWSQRRARGKADGRLQAVRHILEDQTNNKPLSEKVKQTEKLVVEITGMNFDQFTRSMLLAQGEFSKFLKAKTNERSEILEKITDTLEYSSISIAVHERCREENGKLAALEAGIDGMQILSQEQVAEINSELVEIRTRDTKHKDEENVLLIYKKHYERLSEINELLGKLDGDEASCNKRREDLLEDLHRLEIGELVSSHWERYESVLGLQKSQADESHEIEKLKGELAELLNRLKECSGRVEILRNEKKELLSDGDKLNALVKVVRELDSEITGEIRRSTEYQREAETLKAGGKENSGLLADLKVGLGGVESELDGIHRYLADNAGDSELVGELELILDNLRRIYSEKRSLKLLEDESERHSTRVSEQQERYNDLKRSCDEEVKSCKALAGVVDKLEAGRMSLLKGSEKDVYDHRLKKLLEKRDKFEQLNASMKECVELEAELNEYDLRIKRTESELTIQREAAVEVERANELLENSIMHLEHKVKLVDRIKTLSQRRVDLIDGEPCPLCGALEHPYVSEGIPEDDGFAQELREMREKYKLSTQDGVRRSKGIAGLESDIENQNELKKNRGVKYNAVMGSVAQMMGELGLDGGDKSEEMVEAGYSSLKREISELEGLIAGVKKFDDDIAGVKIELSEAKDRLLEDEKRVGRQAAELSAAQRDLQNAHDGLKLSRDNLSKLVELTYSHLIKFGKYEKDEVESEQERIAADLKERSRRYTDQIAQRDKLFSERALLQNRVTELETGAERDRQRLAVIESSLEEAGKELSDLRTQRQLKFGDKDCDAELDRHKKFLTDIDEGINNSITELTELTSSEAAFRAKIESLDKSISSRGDMISKRLDDLNAEIEDSGFGSLDEFIRGRLSDDELQRLRALRDELDTESQSIRQRREILLQERQRLTDSSDMTEDYESVCTKLEGLSRLRNETAQRLGALNNQLEVNAETERLHSRKREEILAQKDVCRKWGNLHDIIGSADGKKYRNFAQGLTFDIMLRYANSELIKMSDRYLLRRSNVESGSGAELLDIDVIDKDQGGMVRSSKNLSGGESFIVSLALALGLSRMSSKKVEVGSLFLDEGFGTLDEDELDRVLSALSRVQQQGKLIGIISHVSALKERIGLQISVDKGAGGRSTLYGAGCRRI